MSEFKVGDQVKVACEWSALKGKVGVVTEIQSNSKLYVHFSGIGGCFWAEDHLVKVVDKGTDMLQKHMDEICDEFDFGKVQKVMEFLGWEWAGAEEGVPREAELRKKVRDLMSACYERALTFEGDWSTATGGFSVKYYFEGDFFDVDFCLTHWTTEYLSYPDEVPF